ncbi:amino acid ABC transporter substrate-binding protein [Mycolicibacterium moriokaense]|nr:amino acid ABC transporter substrate-binding protein [Mycolicibacterium moriokaense]
MSYESSAEPIKIGYLMDFLISEHFPQHFRDDLTDPFHMVFAEALTQGIIDRPVEIIYKEVEGLPKGSVRAVNKAYEELVDEGCLVVFGPNITDNCAAALEVIERRKVPAIGVTGSEEVLGEWFFSFPMGSMTDEPILWSQLLANRGLTDVGLLVEQSLVGESYAKRFHKAAARRGLRIVAEAPIAQTAQDVTKSVGALHEAGATAIVHCGFGFGVVMVNPALDAIDWDPPRFAGTAWQNAWINPVMWNAFMGWIGVDQYDEANPIGQDFLDRYQQRYGRRPEWCVPVVNYDVARTLLEAITDAHPLSPRGLKEAIERVKMLPAASGAPGTYVSFGKWKRQAWVGTGYIVARQLDADGTNSHLVERFGD